VERANGVEEIRLRAKRNRAAMLFIPVWLVPWTIGFVAIAADLLREFDARLLLGLAVCAGCLLLGAALLAWYFAGFTALRVVRGDLEIDHRLAGLGWVRRFEGGEIRGLEVAAAPPFNGSGWLQPEEGLCIRFEHGGRIVHVAKGIEEAEGRSIVDFLGAKLPASATSQP